MQIQQLMNLSSGPDTGAQGAAPLKGDAAAFSRTLASALEGSGSMAETARSVVSELREAMSGQPGGDALFQALSRLQAQWGEAGQSGDAARNGPIAQRQTRLEADGDTARRDILTRLGSIQPGSQASNGSVTPASNASAKPTDNLNEQLSGLRDQLEQVRASLETGDTAQRASVDDLISRMNQLQARLEFGENNNLAKSPALGALLQQLNTDPQRTGDAVRATQANVERNLAEQAQALRQVVSESAGNTASRQGDARSDGLLASGQDGSRSGDGMNNAARETYSGSLAALSGSMSGGTNSAGTAPATATGSLSAPVGTQAWDQQLSQQMIRFSQQGGEQRVNLQLHPPELGSISVRLTVNDQNAQAQFMSHNAQVRQALEQAIPQLRDALAEQGVSLGETTVGEQSTSEGNDARPNGTLTSDPADGGDDPDSEADIATSSRDVPLNGRVDLYA